MKSYCQLTLKQRYAIARHLRNGKAKREIALCLGVHRSTIYRELKRNTFTFALGDREYLGRTAEQLAYERRCERRRGFRKISTEIGVHIREKLQLGWSPEQIAGRLEHEGIIKISHETIYRYILDERVVGLEGLYRYLRCWRYKKSRFGLYKRKRWQKLRPSIESRPIQANQRKHIGHWERDLIIGKRSGHHLLTIVDRKSRFTIIRKVTSRHSHAIFKQMSLAMKLYPDKFKTITNDNGTEFSDFERIKKKYAVPVYFTHPYSAWERGTNENTNKLIREYLPKKTDFKAIDTKVVRQIEDCLNNRPRKILNFKTPLEVFNKTAKEFFSRKNVAVGT